MITWTNCADRMPPDDKLIIVKSHGKVKIMREFIFRVCAKYNPTSYEWCPYTEEAWSELTKVQ